MSFSQSLNKFLDCGASLSRPVRFDLSPTNSSVTVFFGGFYNASLGFGLWAKTLRGQLRGGFYNASSGATTTTTVAIVATTTTTSAANASTNTTATKIFTDLLLWQ